MILQLLYVIALRRLPSKPRALQEVEDRQTRPKTPLYQHSNHWRVMTYLLRKLDGALLYENHEDLAHLGHLDLQDPHGLHELHAATMPQA